MLKLILDHEYKATPPAVDSSPFANHGRIFDADFVPDGRDPGSGALRFAGAGSAVRVAHRDCWRELTAIGVEAWIRAESNGARRNIIEGDGSFAFYIDSNDVLVASFFSLVDGATGPAWNGLSSELHSPDGDVHVVPSGRWSKVVFHFDGITRARLFIDDDLVAVRGDFASAAASVGGAGVVIGNWTLANQFAFAGLIDRVRFLKHDKDAPIRLFGARPVGPEARDCWNDIWTCLRARLHPDLAQQLAELGRRWENLLRQYMRAFHAASPADRDKLREIIDTYKAHWLANTIDSQANVDAVVALRDLVQSLLGSSWHQEAESLANALLEIHGEGAGCIDPARLSEVDPAFAGFIAAAGAKF